MDTIATAAIGLGTMVVSMGANSLANFGGSYVTSMPNYPSALAAGALTGVGFGLGLASMKEVSDESLYQDIYVIAVSILLTAALTPNLPKNWVNCDVSYLGAAGYGAFGSAVMILLAIAIPMTEVKKDCLKAR